MSRENILIQRPGSPYWYFGEWRDGKYKYITTKETDYELAKTFKLKREYARSVETGKAPAPIGSMLLQEVIDLYLKQADIKPNTVLANKYSWRKFQRLTGATTLEAAVAEGIIKKFKEAAAAADVSPAYEALILRDVRKLINYAVGKGMTTANPFIKVRMPQQEEVFRVLTPDEEEKLLAVGEPLLQKFIRFELMFGLRVSQVISLDWKQYDAHLKIFKIPPQKRAPKGRKLPVLDSMLALIGEPKAAGHVFPEFELTTPNRARWNLTGAFRRAKNLAGIAGRMRLHDLRHTCASRMAQRMRPQLVRDFFGWSSMAMVDRYVHTTTEEIRRAMEAA